VVDPAVAEYFEVLGFVPVWCLCVVEGVQHAHAFDGLLLHTVDEQRFGQPGGLQQGRRHIDDMVELPTHFALGGDPLRPMHDRAVAGATPV
jgi:hypothetical protein